MVRQQSATPGYASSFTHHFGCEKRWVFEKVDAVFQRFENVPLVVCHLGKRHEAVVRDDFGDDGGEGLDGSAVHLAIEEGRKARFGFYSTFETFPSSIWPPAITLIGLSAGQ